MSLKLILTSVLFVFTQTSALVSSAVSQDLDSLSGSGGPLIVSAEISDVAVTFPFVPGTSVYLSTGGVSKTFVKTPNDKIPGKSELALKDILISNPKIDEVNFNLSAFCEYYLGKPDICIYRKVGKQHNTYVENIRIRIAEHKIKSYAKARLESRYLNGYNPKFLYKDHGKVWFCQKRLLFDCEYNIVFGERTLLTVQFSMRQIESVAAEEIVNFTDKFAAKLLERNN